MKQVISAISSDQQYRKSLKGEIMSAKFNDKLKSIYQTYKDDENPPVPINKIREYLKLSGVKLDE